MTARRTFRLHVDMDSAAFEDDQLEIARILHAVASQIEEAGEAPSHYRTIFDANGNDVGRFAAKESA